MSGGDETKHRALKDWLDVDRSVVTAVEGIVEQNVTLTRGRTEAILDGMAQLEEQTQKLRSALEASR